MCYRLRYHEQYTANNHLYHILLYCFSDVDYCWFACSNLAFHLFILLCLSWTLTIEWYFKIEFSKKFTTHNTNHQYQHKYIYILHYETWYTCMYKSKYTSSIGGTKHFDSEIKIVILYYLITDLNNCVKSFIIFLFIYIFS